MENIRFGKPEAPDADVISAAKQANAHGFITGFPDGYNTVVGMLKLGEKKTNLVHTNNSHIVDLVEYVALLAVVSHMLQM